MPVLSKLKKCYQTSNPADLMISNPIKMHYFDPFNTEIPLLDSKSAFGSTFFLGLVGLLNLLVALSATKHS